MLEYCHKNPGLPKCHSHSRVIVNIGFFGGGKTVENPSFDIFLMTLQTKKFKEEQKRKYKNDGGKKEYNEIIDLKS